MVIAARTAEALGSIAAELDPTGERVAAQATDICDPDSCAALVDAAVARFGSVDALIQVAAFEHAWGGLYDLKFDDWRKAFDTNVIGALTVIRPVAEAMKTGGGGSVVLIGSQSMFRPPDAPGWLRGVEGRAPRRPCTTCATSSGRTTSAATWSSRRGCGDRRSRCYVTGQAKHQGAPRKRCSTTSWASSPCAG